MPQRGGHCKSSPLPAPDKIGTVQKYSRLLVSSLFIGYEEAKTHPELMWRCIQWVSAQIAFVDRDLRDSARKWIQNEISTAALWNPKWWERKESKKYQALRRTQRKNTSESNCNQGSQNSSIKYLTHMSLITQVTRFWRRREKTILVRMKMHLFTITYVLIRK